MTKTHQLTDTVEHITWVRMRQRCENPQNMDYRNYGGRGIYVSAEWASFEAFLRDMGKRPGTAFSIDRIDSNGPYSKENCRWATKQQQNGNRRSVRCLEYNGRSMIMADWLREVGLDDKRLMVKRRLDVLGWTVGQALGLEPPPVTPPTVKGKHWKPYNEIKTRIGIKNSNYIYISHPVLGDKEVTLKQAAGIMNRKVSTVHALVNRGVPVLIALGIEDSGKQKLIKHPDGRMQTCSQWAREAGIPPKLLWGRLFRQGLSLVDAMKS